jgi:hypothetical protein
LSSPIQYDLNILFTVTKGSNADAISDVVPLSVAVTHWFSAAAPLRPAAAESIAYHSTRYKEQLWQRK